MKFFINSKIRDLSDYEDIVSTGLLSGWGVFETLRVYNRNAAFLDEHIKRLKEGAQKISLDIPQMNFSKEIDNLLNVNNLVNASCRITVFKKKYSSGVIIYTVPFNHYTDDGYKKGFKAVVSQFTKYSKSRLAGLKSISYIENRLAKKEAEDRGAQEALFLTQSGFLAEGSRSNIFFLKGGAVFTPSLDCGILNGITREKVIRILKCKNISLIEGKFSLKDIYVCDEAFLTSSLMEVMPLVKVGSEIIGNGLPGRFTLDILKEYHKLAVSFTQVG